MVEEAARDCANSARSGNITKSKRGGATAFLLGTAIGGAVVALALTLPIGLGPTGERAAASALELRVAGLERRIVALAGERDEANRRREAVSDRLIDAEGRLRAATLAMSERDAALEVALAASEDAERAHRALAAEADAAAEALMDATAELGAIEARRAALEAQLADFAEVVDSVISERDFALARGERLTDEMAGLQIALASAVEREQRLVADLNQAAQQSATGLASIFERAEIDLDRLLSEMSRDYSGQGGPFQPLEERSEDDPRDIELAALSETLERVSLMQFAATKVPFTLPVTGGRLTSMFGLRRDPFRGRTSMHQGIDIAAPRGTPIVATAEGIVTFVGRQRGYGIVVEIRHAFGFETLYAHLSKARVKLGQRVERGTRVGDMGSTGRSTGNHLHYEVRIDNKAVNPMKFIEAARDVL